MAQMFSFDPSKGETQESLRRRREVAQAMLEASNRPAQTLGEGLASFGDSVFGTLREKDVARSEQNSRKMIADALLQAQQNGGITLENSAQMMPYADEGQRFMIAQTLAQQEAEKERANKKEDWREQWDVESGFKAEQAALDRQATLSAARVRAANTDSNSAPVKNFLYRQQLVDKFGEGSPQVNTFDIYVRQNPYIDLGDSKVRPSLGNPSQAIGGFGVGAAPKTEIQDDRVITAPGVPGVLRPNTVVNANSGGPAPGLPSAFPLPDMGGQQQAPQMQTEQPQMQKAPAGPTIQPLPPSPTQAIKAKKAMQAVETTQRVVQTNIDQALAGLTPGTTGLRGYAMAKIPGTDAYDLKAIIDTVKANIGFDKLQAMREASPTGGALGQVSDFENRNLQATLGNLDNAQSLEQVQRNLLEVKRILAESAQARREAYAQDFGVAYDTSEQRGAEPQQPEPRRAPDGNLYVPDPNRPGKWLRVDE